MNIRKIGALAAASVLAIGLVGVVSAASVEPIAHSGNITSEGTFKADCPEGFAPVTVDGGDASASLGGVTVHVTYHDDNSLDFWVSGGTVSVAYVKGGPNYNEYAYPSPVTSDTNLVSPLNGGDQVPAVSHSVYCVDENEEESAPPESAEPSSPPESAEPSNPPESAEPSNPPPSSEPSGEPSSEPSSPPESAAPSSEVSAPPSSEPSSSPESAAPSASASFGGGVGGETDTPTAPPTDQNGIGSNATPTLPLLLIILGVIGLGAVVLTPRRARR